MGGGQRVAFLRDRGWSRRVDCSCSEWLGSRYPFLLVLDLGPYFIELTGIIGFLFSNNVENSGPYFPGDAVKGRCTTNAKFMSSHPHKDGDLWRVHSTQVYSHNTTHIIWVGSVCGEDLDAIKNDVALGLELGIAQAEGEKYTTQAVQSSSSSTKSRRNVFVVCSRVFESVVIVA